MGEDRHAGLGLHKAHQTLAAARHDDIDIGRGAQHFGHHGAVARGDQLDRGLGQTGLAQALLHAGVQRLGGMEAFAATAQDHGIAGLKAQGPGIGGDIGARFIDHAHHAQWGGNALNMQAIRARPLVQNPAHRIALFGHLTQAIDNAAQARLVQHQPVEHGGRQALVAAEIHVEHIGIEDLVPPRPDRGRCRLQGRRLAFRGGIGQLRRRRAGAGADFGHQVGLFAHFHPLPKPEFDPNSAPENLQFSEPISAKKSVSQITISSRCTKAERP